MDELPIGYAELLADLKRQIGTAQVRAAVAVNRELVGLYWRIGRDILTRQQSAGWGAKVIDRLGRDLQVAFPGITGFSGRNLKYMRAFAESWPDEAIVQGPLAQITWYHNLALLEKLRSPDDRLWYARAAVEHGWSRNVLVHQIGSRLHARQGQAITNFDRTLPPAQSDLAKQLLKDPYNFDFLTLATDGSERDLERGLIDLLRNFLVELGVGFAFVGRQHHLEVGGQDFYLDLLFYHLKLRCFVVIDLKVEAFRPEFAGKMNFYLSAADDLLRHATDQPSIGLILCREKNRVIVEYSLRDTSTPMGVAGYELLRDTLPAELRGSLPAAADIEAALNQVEAAPSQED